MTTSFSRSIRVLDADKFRPSLWIIGAAVILLLIWVIWFLFSNMTVLAATGSITISPTGIVKANFSTEEARRIRIGQLGWLQIDEEGIGQFPLIVQQRTAVQGERVIVELLAVDEIFYSLTFPDGVSGKVQVEVERVSPARLVLRSAGQFNNAPTVSVSPQK